MHGRIVRAVAGLNPVKVFSQLGHIDGVMFLQERLGDLAQSDPVVRGAVYISQGAAGFSPRGFQPARISARAELTLANDE